MKNWEKELREISSLFLWDEIEYENVVQFIKDQITKVIAEIPDNVLATPQKIVVNPDTKTIFVTPSSLTNTTLKQKLINI